ncbi:hypothetical protein ACQ4PT_041570 [Festuca glaucescens]
MSVSARESEHASGLTTGWGVSSTYTGIVSPGVSGVRPSLSGFQPPEQLIWTSDCLLPDKAIDLIDEAGSRVRLRHAQVPGEAKELDKNFAG